MPKFIPPLIANSVADRVVRKLNNNCRFFGEAALSQALNTKIKKDVFQKLTAVELTEQEAAQLDNANSNMIEKLTGVITGELSAQLLRPGAATGEGLVLEYYNSLHYNPANVTAALTTGLLSRLFDRYRFSGDIVVAPRFLESAFTEQSVRLKQVASVVHLAFAAEMTIPQLSAFLEQFLHVAPSFAPGLLLREEQGSLMTYFSSVKHGNTTTWQNFVRKLQEMGSSKIQQVSNCASTANDQNSDELGKLVVLVNETIPGHTLKPVAEALAERVAVSSDEPYYGEHQVKSDNSLN